MRFLLFFLTLVAAPLSAREFYALLAADTITEVRKASKQDLANVKHEIKKAAKAVGARFTITELYGKKLTAANLQLWLNQKTLKHDDIIFFYYTGHGLRTAKSLSIWPYLFFPAKKELIDTHQFLSYIQAKGAGLSIVLADCCNNLIRQDATPLDLKTKSEQNLLEKRMKRDPSSTGYKRLFYKAKGCIIASSSIPGKRSFATSKGGIFTNAFLYSLESELEEPFPAWEHVLNKTKSYCLRFQKPQYQTKVSYQ